MFMLKGSGRGVALEGTAILARAKGKELERQLGRATVNRARRWLQ